MPIILRVFKVVQLHEFVEEGKHSNTLGQFSLNNSCIGWQWYASIEFDHDFKFHYHFWFLSRLYSSLHVWQVIYTSPSVNNSNDCVSLRIPQGLLCSFNFFVSFPKKSATCLHYIANPLYVVEPLLYVHANWKFNETNHFSNA